MTQDNWGKGYSEETLEQALKRCYGNASKTLYSQAMIAAKEVATLYADNNSDDIHDFDGWSMNPISVEGWAIRKVTKAWYLLGLSPATINKRLNCLSKMGVSVEGLRVKNPKSLKWYLPEDIKEVILKDLRGRPAGRLWHILADFIEWTTLTGLRVEESLRLNFRAFDAALTEVRVPGTKTASSEATLPLGNRAAQLVHGRVIGRGGLPASAYSQELVFPVGYDLLNDTWQKVRAEYGWKDDPTATLKALRRSAARYLHVDCGMPLHMVQQYLRHESMDTTLEYLRLTGGYGTEEMRRYLK